MAIQWGRKKSTISPLCVPTFSYSSIVTANRNLGTVTGLEGSGITVRWDDIIRTMPRPVSQVRPRLCRDRTHAVCALEMDTNRL
jgi:hypothetical protein